MQGAKFTPRSLRGIRLLGCLKGSIKILHNYRVQLFMRGLNTADIELGQLNGT